jgi:hypothetical protein
MSTSGWVYAGAVIIYHQEVLFGVCGWHRQARLPLSSTDVGVSDGVRMAVEIEEAERSGTSL